MGSGGCTSPRIVDQRWPERGPGCVPSFDLGACCALLTLLKQDTASPYRRRWENQRGPKAEYYLLLPEAKNKGPCGEAF